MLIANFLCHMQDSGDDSEREPKIRFEGEDHPETERHDKLRRRDTPHYLKNKRIDLQSSDPEKVKEILAKAGSKDVEGQKPEVVRSNVVVVVCKNSRAFLQGSRDGAVGRALASHQCGPGSIPRLSVTCQLSLLLVLVLAPRGFSPGTVVAPSPQKTNISKFQFNLDYFKHFIMSLQLYDSGDCAGTTSVSVTFNKLLTKLLSLAEHCKCNSPT